MNEELALRAVLALESMAAPRSRFTTPTSSQPCWRTGSVDC